MLRKINRAGSGKKPFTVIGEALLCAISAALLFCAFPYFNKEYLAWFAFVPWFFAIRGKSLRTALALSYLTGLLFWGALVYWIIHVTLAGLIGLVMFLALYFAAFGFILTAAGRGGLSIAKIVFISSAWVLIEYLRSHLLTGFPWGLLGYTQYLRLPAIQIADVTGVWGVSFLVMAVNVCAAGIISELFSARAPARRLKISPVVFTLALVAACYGYGTYRLSHLAAAGAQYRVAVVQGNISHEDKWLSGAEDWTMKRHLALSSQAVEGKGVDLLVWSEAALPVVLEDRPEYFQKTVDFVAANKVPLLMGAITHRGLGRFYNSALLLSETGKVAQTYDKMHLVPFGEYVPLRGVFPFLETLAPIGEMTRGEESIVFHLSRNKRLLDFSTLICFEDLFPEMASACVRSGARMLVNITNDAWYRFSAATYQHCQAAVFRAVENRVPLVRCANTGVSCFIDASGRITSVLRDAFGRELFVEGEAASAVTVPAKASTFYTRFGDYFVGLCLLMALFGAFSYFRDKGRRDV
jgi:apolipoprotein N-acyltransferase